MPFKFKYIYHLSAALIITVILAWFLISRKSKAGTESPDDGSLVFTGEKIFKKNCVVCHHSHTNEDLTGPGLKGVFERIPKPSEEWFTKYVLNNEKVFKSGDEYAIELKKKYKAEMPVFEGELSEEDIKELIVFLKSSEPEVNL